MRGFDPEDLTTRDALGKDNPSLLSNSLAPASFSGFRIGILEDLFREGDQFAEINGLIRSEIDAIAKAGAVVVPRLTLGLDIVSFFPQLRHSVPEFEASFNAYLQRRGKTAPFSSLDELRDSGQYLPNIAWALNRTLKESELQWDGAYLARLANRQVLRRQLTELMDRHQLDALVYPFKALTAPPLGQSDRGERDNPVSSTTGLPAIVLPAGVASDGLPISIEFLGRRFHEREILRIAHAYEALGSKRLKPNSAPPLDGDLIRYVVP
jgi:Asp-tRNA(Asn)/Glu-tRNA(Gln) amidotransferase A subunit family amidase